MLSCLCDLREITSIPLVLHSSAEKLFGLVYQEITVPCAVVLEGVTKNFVDELAGAGSSIPTPHNKPPPSEVP